MQLQGERVYIRRAQVDDAEALCAFHARNRVFFDPTRPAWSEEEFELESIRERLNGNKRRWEQDEAYCFHVFLNETDELVGTVDLVFVKRGPLQSAMLGYELDQAHNGKGLMTEAARLCIAFGFEHAKFHRIEAGAMPRNEGSNRVLEKLGFTLEGLNRKIVQINGEWEDHNLWAMLESDWEARKEK